MNNVIHMFKAPCFILHVKERRHSMKISNRPWQGRCSRPRLKSRQDSNISFGTVCEIFLSENDPDGWRSEGVGDWRRKAMKYADPVCEMKCVDGPGGCNRQHLMDYGRRRSGFCIGSLLLHV